MNNKKRICILEFTLLLICFLSAGCYSDYKSEIKPEDVITSSIASSVQQIPAENIRSDEIEKLQSILTDIEQHMYVATAGSSLTAVNKAAALMDWAVATSLTNEEIQAATKEWIALQDIDKTFLSQFEAVYYTYLQLLKDDQEGLLADAGCLDAHYPWSKEPIEAIEIIMDVIIIQLNSLS